MSEIVRDLPRPTVGISNADRPKNAHGFRLSVRMQHTTLGAHFSRTRGGFRKIDSGTESRSLIGSSILALHRSLSMSKGSEFASTSLSTARDLPMGSIVQNVRGAYRGMLANGAAVIRLARHLQCWYDGTSLSWMAQSPSWNANTDPVIA